MKLGLKDSEISEEDLIELEQSKVDEAKAKSIIEEAFNSIKELNVKVELERHGWIGLNPIDFSYEKRHSNRLINKILSKWK